MSYVSRIVAAMIVAFGVLAASAGSTPARADQQGVLDHAVATVSDMRVDPTFGPSRSLLRSARAILIVPQLIKGGFIFGGEGGDGVMLARLGAGWSPPAFYTLRSE